MLVTSKMLTQFNPKHFHTFGKHVCKKRCEELRRMRETFKDIAHEEGKVTKKLMKQHKRFFILDPPAQQHHERKDKVKDCY